MTADNTRGTADALRHSHPPCEAKRPTKAPCIGGMTYSIMQPGFGSVFSGVRRFLFAALSSFLSSSSHRGEKDQTETQSGEKESPHSRKDRTRQSAEGIA